ncbi:TPA: MBL fold metallo-hydrolase [candidate division WOR-3 bacterium]|jgi:flavorubredoxin|uniref:MBL fold metallo-hydrolase n=1 Tax=candidate division WOR-3 bacterium TaxID=2052148 RepID=A0A350H9B7_UNCW3|nr:MBL fold metallo-hydrolase [candidate division WOR-3 bacterium]
MKPVKITDKIYWVGAIDWDLRDFHGYTTERGSTYNAYLILDKEPTLVDTVKHYKFDEMMSRIKELIDPKDIKHIISNHVEMDHSGSIPKILEYAKNSDVITNPQGERGLKNHFFSDMKYRVVKSGDILDIGDIKILFHQTPMVHWPDNMVSYIEKNSLLFSNDAFGQHIASFERFDDELSLDETLKQAKKYYANIVLPYSQQVKTALDALAPLKINTICPSHGIIWRKDIPILLNEYKKWSANTTQKKAVIVYDTMWGSTEKIALKIYEAFEESGYKTVLANLKSSHISDIMTEIIDAEYIAVGSPTLNKNMLPSVSGFLTYLNGLSPKKRKSFAFGSYGWGGESIKDVEDVLKKSGFEVLNSIKMQFVPKEPALTEIKNKLKGDIND